MVITTLYFPVTLITKAEVAEHLIPNILKFKIMLYLKEEFRGGTPGTGEEKDVLKVQILCQREVHIEVMSYLKEHYVKGYGAIVYYEEVKIPL